MNKKYDGGVAFPVSANEYRPGNPWLGMSLRDWYAGMVIQGLLSTTPNGYGDMSHEERATWAFEQADALIAERQKNNAQG